MIHKRVCEDYLRENNAKDDETTMWAEYCITCYLKAEAWEAQLSDKSEKTRLSPSDWNKKCRVIMKNAAMLQREAKYAYQRFVIERIHETRETSMDLDNLDAALAAIPEEDFTVLCTNNPLIDLTKD